MRYFLAQDCSCHWYVVPVEKRNEWNEWCEIDEDDERSWIVPEYAYEIGGCPSQIEFENWEYKQ